VTFHTKGHENLSTYLKVTAELNDTQTKIKDMTITQNYVLSYSK
jgi:hypothetical protein